MKPPQSSSKHHLLIESESAFHHALKHLGNTQRVSYCTSPWLLEKLPATGEEVKSLEEGMTASEFCHLGLLGKELSKRIVVNLDRSCGPLPYGVRLGSVLAPSLRKSLFAVLYKQILLNHWLAGVQGGDSGYVIGSCELEDAHGLALPRFGTLYAILASAMDLPAQVAVLRCPSSNTSGLVDSIKRLGTTKEERLLSLLNSNYELLLFKIWKRVFREKPIRLPLWSQKSSIALLDDCELVEEAFFHLLLRGCNLWRLKLGKLPPSSRESKPEMPPAAQIDETIQTCVSKTAGLDELLGSGLKSFSRILSRLLQDSLHSCARNIQMLEPLKERLMESQGRNGAAPLGIVGNGLFSPLQRMSYDLAKSMGIPVFVSEHGVTAGLSLMTEHSLEEDPLGRSNMVLCYNQGSRDYHARNWNQSQECVVTGMPKVNRKLRWPRIQKSLSRRLIGAPLGKRIVIYVANLFFNNFVYSPGACPDGYYHNFRKTVVYECLGGTDDFCLVKLYPTHRYTDPDPISGVLNMPQNVKVIQFFEFRYLRALGDVIICDSPQSTLGWVWSAGVPTIYLDLPYNPLCPEVADDFEKALFRIDCSRPDWPVEVKRLLEMPQPLLMKQWMAKGKARDAAGEKFIFGPRGNAGRRAACEIVRSIEGGGYSHMREILDSLFFFPSVTKTRCILLLSITLCATILEGFGVATLLPVMDFVEKGKDFTVLANDSRMWFWINRGFDVLRLPKNLLALMTIVFLLLMLRQVFTFARTVYTSWITESILSDIRSEGFKWFVRAEVGFYDLHSIGQLMNGLTIDGVRAGGGIFTIFSIVSSGATFLVYLLLLLVLSPKMTLFAVVIMGAVGITFRSLITRTGSIGLEVSKLNEKISSAILERLNGIRLLKLSATEKREVQHVRELSLGIMKATYDLSMIKARMEFLIEPMILVAGLAILYFSVEIAHMNLAKVGMFLFVMLRLLPYTRDYLKSRQNLAGFSGSMFRVKALLQNARHGETIKGGTKNFSELRNGIAFENVSFSYGKEESFALENVTMFIPAGKMTALVGRSGAGKSTLVDLIPRLRVSNSGRITLDKVPIDEFDLSALRSSIAFVSQEGFLFNETIENNIKYNRPEASLSEVRKAAGMAYADGFILGLAKGYQTVVGDRGAKLSGGQKQRIILARALLQNASIIILDEPTSALDSESEKYIQKAISEIRFKGSVTLIVIAHRLSTIRSADQIVVMDKGRIVEYGSHSELMHEETWYADMVRMQALA